VRNKSKEKEKTELQKYKEWIINEEYTEER